jgi:FixJ family two-component response regulator
LKSIAIVDDDEDTVNLFTELLQENGFEVIGFESPFSFLDYFSQNPDHKFSLILIDYMMSNMTGSELATKLASIDPTLPMILVTAYGEIHNNPLNLDVIKKPITLRGLLKVVNQYIDTLII